MEYPQRISNLSTEAVGEGLAVLDAGRKQSYVLNTTSALVFQHCDGRTSPEQMTEILRQKSDLRPAEAEQLTQAALEALKAAELLVPAAVHPATFSRRQALTTLATLGLSVALLPLVARVASAGGGGHHDDDHGGHSLIPLLDCVDDNGDGTYTAHFGYLNNSHHIIILPVGPWNRFVGLHPYRGQPVVFHPGAHPSVFTVVFHATETLKWVLKALGDHLHQVEANADSESCTTEQPPTEQPPTEQPPTEQPPTEQPPTEQLRRLRSRDGNWAGRRERHEDHRLSTVRGRGHPSSCPAGAGRARVSRCSARGESLLAKPPLSHRVASLPPLRGGRVSSLERMPPPP